MSDSKVEEVEEVEKWKSGKVEKWNVLMHARFRMHSIGLACPAQ